MAPFIETEVKLASGDLNRLRNAGFHLTQTRPRHFEDNWLLDTQDNRLLEAGAALRVRSVEGRGLITYKGLVEESAASRLKVREEVEFETAEPEEAIELLEKLGFRRTFRYQKFRTVYRLVLDSAELEVEYDETPMGNFIEIEGEEDAVLRVVSAAGFTDEEFIRESYPDLQARRCRERGVPLEDLVFTSVQHST